MEMDTLAWRKSAPVTNIVRLQSCLGRYFDRVFRIVAVYTTENCWGAQTRMNLYAGSELPLKVIDINQYKIGSETCISSHAQVLISVPG